MSRTDQPAQSALAFVAEGHDTGGAAMDAEFMLDTDAFEVIQAAIFKAFGNEEERNPLGSLRRVGEPCEHEVQDLVCHRL